MVFVYYLLFGLGIFVCGLWFGYSRPMRDGFFSLWFVVFLVCGLVTPAQCGMVFLV
jgi:hypothetical protein